MIPENIQEYQKYFKLFRGNNLKGLTFLKMLMDNREIMLNLVKNINACSSIFTDASRSTADGLCLNQLTTNQEYYEKAYFTYANATGITTTQNSSELIKSQSEIFKAVNTTINKGLLYRLYYFVNNLFKYKPNFDSIVLNQNRSAQQLALLDDTTLGAKYYQLWPETNNSSEMQTAMNKAVIDAGYSISTWGGFHYVKKWNQYFRTATRNYNDIYQPLLIRYNATTKIASIVVLDDTYTATGTNYDSGICPYPAYDESDDTCYLFYNHATTSYRLYCCAVSLTENSQNTLFKGKVVCARPAQSSTYFQIINVTAANGKASCAMYNYDIRDGGSNSDRQPVVVGQILRDSTCSISNLCACPRNYSYISNYRYDNQTSGGNATGGIVYGATWSNPRVEATIGIPRPDGAGGFIIPDIYKISTNDYPAANFTSYFSYNFYSISKDLFFGSLFLPASSSKAQGMVYVYGGFQDGTSFKYSLDYQYRNIGGGFSGSLKYDPFCDAFYFYYDSYPYPYDENKSVRKYYRVTKKDITEIDVSTYAMIPIKFYYNGVTRSNSITNARASEIPYEFFYNGGIYNILPNLTTEI